MKPFLKSIEPLTLLLILSFLIPLFQGFAVAGEKKIMSPENESGRYVSIDFNDVDINVFIKFISELTGKNFVIDQRVKGKVTIISPAKISEKEAYKVFESVLEIHGYTTVKAGEVIKIVPSPDARSKNIETLLKNEARSPEDKVVTQLIPLTYADPDEIKRLFAPLVSKSSVILAYPPTSMLIVTDVYSNIKRLLRIVKVIDVVGIGREISVIPLEFAEAGDLEKLLISVFRTKQSTKKRGIEKAINIVSDERTNTLVILASEDDTKKIKKLISLLDKDVPRGKEKIHVVYLENATAEELAKVLQTLSTKQGGSEKGKKKSPVISDKVKITADKATNSLIIMAEKEDYKVINEIIKKLDIPRSMVYLESLIMEVNVTKNFELGVEWQAGNTFKDSKGVGGFGGGFRTGDTKTQTSTLVAPLMSGGFSMGLLGPSIEISGIQYPNFGAIVKAYKKDSDVYILSTPQLLTTDNEEASIYVGRNIPYITRQDTTSGTSDINYSNYEYKDVGKKLKITPQISEDRFVRLIISLEVSDLEATTDFRPTTLKRTIDTTVLVKDKGTVVIGGLIGGKTDKTEYKVPCLGDIPGLGLLFSSVAKENIKTNLFVFITPHVIKNPAEAKAIYKIKKEQIDNISEGKIKMYEKGTGKAETPPAPLKGE